MSDETPTQPATTPETPATSPTGTPVIPAKFTPFIFMGFTLCGAVTSVAVSMENIIPRPVLVIAAIGSIFFGGLLGISPGWRKRE